MCGIAGGFSFYGERLSSDVLKKMVVSLRHRGPDSTGYYLGGGVALGHARLSIVDVAGGSQPIHNESKTLQVIFNGEIFNYIELREDLKRKGHVFYTQSDTEVIVHLYEEYGQEFVDHLNGQFAIALWDGLAHTLLLIRDRVGIHPLHYTTVNGQFLFASEIKALLPALPASPSISAQSLDQIMTFWSPVAPNTAFENIFQVGPGEMLVINEAGISPRIYWDWHFPSRNDDYLDGSVEDHADQLRELLIDATKIRLRSDVPVGAYLSGGLDSSVLTSLMHNFSDVSMRTFSIGFDDKSLDESSYQQEMIAHIQTNHSAISCRNIDVADNFLSAIWHTESPILRTAPVPMKLLSGLVHRSGYKVVLTGEGADEVLGGYDIFKEAKIRSFWAKFPKSDIRPMLIKRLYPYLDLTKSNSRAYLEAFFGMGIDSPDVSYFSHIPRWVTTSKCKEFFSEELNASLNTNAIQLLSQTFPMAMQGWNPFNKGQYIESKTLMAGYLLCSQGDRMLMANSVEGRFPFLDHRVIEFCNKLKPSEKMKVLNEKYILKKSMKDFLPKKILNRYKQPYRAPDISAFIHEGREAEYVSELMGSDRIKSCGYFDSKKVDKLLLKVRKGRAIGYKDNMAFVGILSTQALHSLFVK